MVGYLLENTLTENGHVARGVCEVTGDGYLKGISERTKIMWCDGEIRYTENDEDWISVPRGTTVSMNFWGFTPSMMKEIGARFPAFLDKALAENPLKGEFLLPLTADQLLKENKAKIKIMTSKDRWFGVTYKEDRQSVVDALQSMKDKGLYPEKLWIDDNAKQLKSHIGESRYSRKYEKGQYQQTCFGIKSIDLQSLFDSPLSIFTMDLFVIRLLRC
jgi:hypothetical protein